MPTTPPCLPNYLLSKTELNAGSPGEGASDATAKQPNQNPSKKRQLTGIVMHSRSKALFSLFDGRYSGQANAARNFADAAKAENPK
jgi:hypothetical protein